MFSIYLFGILVSLISFGIWPKYYEAMYFNLLKAVWIPRGEFVVFTCLLWPIHFIDLIRHLIRSDKFKEYLHKSWMLFLKAVDLVLNGRERAAELQRKHDREHAEWLVEEIRKVHGRDLTDKQIIEIIRRIK